MAYIFVQFYQNVKGQLLNLFILVVKSRHYRHHQSIQHWDYFRPDLRIVVVNYFKDFDLQLRRGRMKKSKQAQGIEGVILKHLILLAGLIVFYVFEEQGVNF